MSSERPAVTFLVMRPAHMGGTELSTMQVARRLSVWFDVSILGIARDGEAPSFDSGGTPTRYLLDRRVSTALSDGAVDLQLADPADLDRRPPRLVDPTTESGLSELAEVALAHALSNGRHDVIIATTPSLLALATHLAPPTSVVIGVEHRATAHRAETVSTLRHYAPRADAMVTLTADTRTWLGAMLGADAPRLRVIASMLPDRPVMTSSLECPVVVASGASTPEANIAELIRAFAPIAERHPDWSLRIFDSGPRTPVLRRLIRRLELHDHVDLVPGVSDIPLELARASVLAVTSESEWLPLMVLEAIAAGVPVVSYDGVGGVRDLVRNGGNGLLVRHRDVAALSAALDGIMADGDLRAHLGRGALDRRADFLPRTIASAWRELLEECLAHRERVPLRSARILTRTIPQIAPLDPLHATAHEQTRLILDMTVDALNACGATWFASRDERGDPEIAISRNDAERFLRAIGRTGRPLFIAPDSTRDRWVLLRTDVHDAASLLRDETGVWLMTESHLSALNARGRSLRLRFWTPRPDGRLTTAAETRASTVVDPAAIGSTSLDIAGRPLPSILDFSAPWSTDIGFPIDAVVTWVDGSDMAWQQRKAERLASGDWAGIDIGDERFRDIGELRYALRSIHGHAPWIRHVWLVTDRQVPSWLRRDTPNLTVVDHREIFPDPNHLPVFNSHAIEANLHRIDGLAEHFLAVNDDILLARPSFPDEWFNAAGQSIHYLSPGYLGADDDPDQRAHMRSGRRVRALLEQRFGRRPHRRLLHTPHALRRSFVEQLESEMSEEFQRASAAPFRGDEVSVASLLYPYWAILSGRGVVADSIETTFLDIRTTPRSRYDAVLADASCAVVCMAESVSTTLTPEHISEAQRFMERLLPVPSPWEDVG